MRRPGEVLSRFQILEHAWDYEYENRSNVVDAYIRLLRRKIDQPIRRREHRDRARSRLPAARGRRALSRVPVKLRVTLVFAALMAVVLVATGLFLYLRLELGARRLDRSRPPLPRARADQRDQGERRSASARPLGARSAAGARAFAQVLTPSGRLFDASAQPTSRPVLTPGELRAAARRADRRRPNGRSRPTASPSRLLATAGPLRAPPAHRGRGRVARRPRAMPSRACHPAPDRRPGRLSCSPRSPRTGPWAARFGRSRRCEAARPRSRRPGSEQRLPVPPARDELRGSARP